MLKYFRKKAAQNYEIQKRGHVKENLNERVERSNKLKNRSHAKLKRGKGT